MKFWVSDQEPSAQVPFNSLRKDGSRGCSLVILILRFLFTASTPEPPEPPEPPPLSIQWIRPLCWLRHLPLFTNIQHRKKTALKSDPSMSFFWSYSLASAVWKTQESPTEVATLTALLKIARLPNAAITISMEVPPLGATPVNSTQVGPLLPADKLSSWRCIEFKWTLNNVDYNRSFTFIVVQ